MHTQNTALVGLLGADLYANDFTSTTSLLLLLLVLLPVMMMMMM